MGYIRKYPKPIRLRLGNTSKKATPCLERLFSRLYKIPEDRDKLVRFLRELDTTHFRWAGYRKKPSTHVPECCNGWTGTQNYIVFQRNGTIGVGTDIWFFPNTRPEEISNINKLLKLDDKNKKL